jgi:hypothetical protein
MQKAKMALGKEKKAPLGVQMKMQEIPVMEQALARSLGE